MKFKAGIYGAAGYTGLELIRLLKSHPQMNVAFATSDTYAGQDYLGTPFIPADEADPSSVDIVFLCTPHGASASLAKQVLSAGAKVVDLSADLRLKTIESYSKWYGADHPEPDLLPTVYGLPEFNREHIIGQDRIANPGCYPTTTLLGLGPLAKVKAIREGVPLIVDAKSGVSGAGRKPKLDTHFVEVFGDFKPYNIGRVHRHVGEIEQELTTMNPALGTLIFSPHLLPIDRGLLATSYVPLADGWTLEKARKVFEAFYCNEPFTRLLDEGKMARVSDVSRQNGAVVSLHDSGSPDTLIVVSVTDNLLKGASSQALHNANLMLDIPETAGLL
jgi:N-acetyl-gamma-glutamyl-phosphate reductase